MSGKRKRAGKKSLPLHTMTQDEIAFKFEDKKASVDVIIHCTDVREGLRRGAVVASAMEEPDSVLRASISLNADCVFCSEGTVTFHKKNGDETIDVKEMTPDLFLTLSEDMADRWLEIVFKQNPRWQPTFIMPIDQKKI